MKPEKNNKSSLENRKGTFLLAGAAITLSLILAGFEWTTVPEITEHYSAGTELAIDIDLIKPIPRDEKKPEEMLPSVNTDIKPVDETGIEIEKVNFDTEVTKDSRYPYLYMPDPGDDIEVIDEVIPVVLVAVKPMFNGGDPMTEFRKYIAKHLIYPDEALRNGIYGKVFVQFVVDKKGMITGLKIIRGVHPDLDNEALRVISSAPKWTPGMQNGKPVNVMFTFPINFVIN